MPNGKNEFANKSANGLDNINADYCTVLQDLEVFGDTLLHTDLTVEGATTLSGGVTGAVTSVGISVPPILQVANTPITSAGTIAITTTDATTGSGGIVLQNAPTITGVPLLSTANATTLGITQATGNTLNVQSTGTSISPGTGAATIAGGVGIGDNLFVQNGISGSVLTSTETTTAPLIVTSTAQVANLYSSRAALADTVTTNANLPGPITSVGNATAVASQTGTGSTFVMNTNPTISNLTLSGLTSSQPVFTNGTNGLVSNTTTGTGDVVMSSDPSITNASLTTTILGTPQSGDLSNCSGTASNLTAGNVTNSSTDFAGTPFTTGGVVTAFDTNTITSTTAGTAGQILVSNGTGVAPTFQYSGAALPDFGNYSINSTVVFTTSPANATLGDNYKSTTTFSFYLSTDPG